ncbi:hypothetical protein [Nocardia farcinica]|uniref:hypothetical protein n=1 Tax=Nocardia farcinica TaxID=37329 RepID=UPI0024588C7E|nr:hypothetical protein [Nocardia farcinica]
MVRDRGNVVIEATKVRYYSLDEAAFVSWLRAIECVKSLEGRERTLYITIDLTAVDEGGLRELVALYSRYDLDLARLRVLQECRVGPWFSSPARWWHDEVSSG